MLLGGVRILDYGSYELRTTVRLRGARKGIDRSRL